MVHPEYAIGPGKTCVEGEPGCYVHSGAIGAVSCASQDFCAAVTYDGRIRARFRFYSPTRVRGFECKRDHGPYRPCHSPLRYWVTRGRHVLRVRAVGPTGLRGPPAIKRFRVIHHRLR